MKKIFTFLVAFLATLSGEVWGQSLTFSPEDAATYNKGVYTVTKSATITANEATSDIIEIERGVGTKESPIKLTLNGVSFTNEDDPAISTDRNFVEITLEGTNSMKSQIEMDYSASLSINGSGSLSIETSDYGYAIGATSGNDINISDVSISIKGQYGIGGTNIGSVSIKNAEIDIALSKSGSTGIEGDNVTIDGSQIEIYPDKTQKNAKGYGIRAESLSIINNSFVSAITKQGSNDDFDRTNWSGIVFESIGYDGSSLGAVYGNATLKKSIKFSDIAGDYNATNDMIFVIPEGSNLNLEKGATISSNGAKVCIGKGNENLKNKITGSFKLYQIDFEKPVNWPSDWNEPIDEIELFDQIDKMMQSNPGAYFLNVEVGDKEYAFGRSGTSTSFVPLYISDGDYEMRSYTVAYEGTETKSYYPERYTEEGVNIPSFIMPEQAVTIKDIEIVEKKYDLNLDYYKWMKVTFYDENGNKITEARKNAVVYAVIEIADEIQGVVAMKPMAGNHKEDKDGKWLPTVYLETLKSHDEFLDADDELSEYRVYHDEDAYPNVATRYVYKFTVPDYLSYGIQELPLHVIVDRYDIKFFDVTVDPNITHGTVLVKEEKDPDATEEPTFLNKLEDVGYSETITVQVTPETDYNCTALYYTYTDKDGKVISTEITKNNMKEYSFDMPPADVTVYAEFKKPYIITIDPDMENGTLLLLDKDVFEVDGQDAAYAGSEIDVVSKSNEGYKIQEGSLKYFYTDNGEVVVEDILNNTFEMPARNITLTAKFIPVDEYIVTVSDNIENGKVTIEPDGVKTKVVKAGEKVELAIAPETDYEASSVTYTGEDGVPHIIESTSFIMPASNVTINATFVLKPTTGDDDDDEESSGIAQKRYRLYLADQDFYLNDEYDEAGLVLYSRHDKKYTDVGGSFTIWFEKHGEVNEGARVFISNRANGEYKEVKLDEVSGYYQIRNVQSNIYVKLYTEEGFPVANESIEATDARAYAQANKIVVITPEPTDVQIISMAGAVVASAQVAGQQEFANLAEGVYIVRMGNEIVKLQVRN